MLRQTRTLPSPLTVAIWYVTLGGAAIALIQRAGGDVSSLGRALTGAFALGAIAHGILKWHQPGAPGKALTATGMTYFAIQVFSYGVNDLDDITIFNYQMTFLVAVPAMLLLIRADGRSREELLRLAYSVAASVVAASVALAVAWPPLAYGDRLGDIRRWQVLGLEWRLSGVTPHQNLLAVTAIIAILLALHLRTRYWTVVVAASVIAIALAEARNAALTAIAVLVIYWLVNGRMSPIRLIAALAGGWIAVTFAADALAGSASDLASGAEDLNNRSEIWDQVLAAWDHSFWIGYGPTSFAAASGSPFSTIGFYNAHNQFFEGIAEGGLAGLAAILAFFAVLVGITWKNRHIALYPALLITLLSSSATEVFFTVHQYGLSYAAVPAFLLLIVFNAGTRPIMRSADVSDHDAALPTQAAVKRMPLDSSR